MYFFAGFFFLEQISPLCMYDQTERVLVAMFSLLLHTDNSIMCVLFLLLSSISIIFVSLLLSPKQHLMSTTMPLTPITVVYVVVLCQNLGEKEGGSTYKP
jgi:hypothetical protein